ncbi:MAG: UbiA family prenyltransferase [Methanobacterium sp. ERen5]|nr:MAG: UbiA family prenyltransferase [Methanobacterium sp. ERen5]
MNAYLEILRPFNALMGVVAVLLVALISGNFTMAVIVACIIVFIFTGAGNAINDYFDHKIDAINKPERPIPSGRIALKTALIYSVSLFVLSSIMAFIIGIIPGMIVVLSAILMYLYAKRLKTSCLVGNLSIAFLTGLCFVFGGVVLNAVELSIILGVYAFLMTMAREIVKDMEDVEGDSVEGASTFPIKYGMRKSSIVAAAFMLIASLTSPILYFIGIFNIIFLIVMLVAIYLFLSCAISTLRDQSVENTRKVSKQIKIGMGIVFMAFALGSPIVTNLLHI